MTRIDYYSIAKDGISKFLNIKNYVLNCSLEPSLIHLVLLRISQINGCSYCVDLHWQDAMNEGMEPRVLNGLVTWQHMPFFNFREKAAFAWAEAVTKLEGQDVPEELFTKLKAHFTEKEIADLTYTVAYMNAMNRIAIAFGKHAEE